MLDKNASGLKLKIAGSIFQASAAFNIKTGESFIARVISLNPFTLSLGNILQGRTMDKALIEMILSKLKLKDSSEVKKLLKAAIEEKKPILKSRLEELSERLEKSGLDLDEQQLAFLVQYFLDERRSYESEGHSSLDLFRYTPSGITARIFEDVKEIMARQPGRADGGIGPKILSGLTVDASSDPIDTALSLKDSFKNILKTIEILSDNNSGDLPVYKKLRDDLLQYALLRSAYQKTGRYPEFMIIRDGDDLSLLEFEISEEHTPEMTGYDGSRRIKLDVNTDSLGGVKFEAFYVPGSMRASLSSCADEEKLLLEADSEELKRSLEQSIQGKVSLNIFAGLPLQEPSVPERRRINFKI